MQKIKHLTYIFLILLLASCASSKQTVIRKQTISQRAQVTLALDQHQYKTACTLKVWKNELIILSVLPMMGIEMFRLEASPEQIIVIDKLHKQYAVLSYEDINEFAPTRLSFKKLQSIVKLTDKELKFDFKIGTRVLKLTGNFGQPEYNTLKDPQPLNKTRYKQVSLREILPI